MSYYIRRSKESDKDAFKELMLLCFGIRRQSIGWLDNFEDRYLLAFDGDLLVAATGIFKSEEYDAYEVDWTGTRPEYRNKGVMNKLFRVMLQGVSERVVCSCWHLSNKERINLYSLMKSYGFIEVLPTRVIWDTRYNCQQFGKCTGCVPLTDGDVPYCTCREDLWIRKEE